MHAEELLMEERIRDAQTSDVVIVFMALRRVMRRVILERGGCLGGRRYLGRSHMLVYRQAGAELMRTRSFPSQFLTASLLALVKMR